MPLKKKEIETYKKRLEELRNEITALLQEATKEVKKPDEATGYSQHQADQGSDDFDRSINLEVTGQEFEILKQIDRALEKITEETYGICDLSGDEIPKKRLDAVPYATMTVDAQDKKEKGLL